MIHKKGEKLSYKLSSKLECLALNFYGVVLGVCAKAEQPCPFGIGERMEAQRRGATWLVLQKWDDPNPKTGERKPYTLQENMDEIEQVVPVIYVQPRAV